MTRSEKTCMLLFNDDRLHPVFFIHSLQLSDAFDKSTFFARYVTFLYFDDR